MPYPSPMPEYQPLFHQVQNFIADQLNSDPQLSGIGIEFLPESQLDIEYGIKRNLGRQGMVGIVNTLKGTYGGHDQDSCAWEIESEIDVLETPTVRRAWLKKNDLSAGTTVDVLNYIQESLCGPASPTYGKFCPVTQEVGEDNGVVVGKAVVKTFAIADVSACVSGESNWHIRYATQEDVSALWDAIEELSAEISGGSWRDAIDQLSADVSALTDRVDSAEEQIENLDDLAVKYTDDDKYLVVLNPRPNWTTSLRINDGSAIGNSRIIFGTGQEVSGLVRYNNYISRNEVVLGLPEIQENPEDVGSTHVQLGGVHNNADLVLGSGIHIISSTEKGKSQILMDDQRLYVVTPAEVSAGQTLKAVQVYDDPTLNTMSFRGMKSREEPKWHWEYHSANLPDKTSDLTNDSGYVTSAYVEDNSGEWNVWRRPSGMKFTAEEANSTVSMSKSGTPPSVSLEYSIDNGATWSDFIVSSIGVEGTTITLAEVGSFVKIRAKTTNTRMGTDQYSYNYFVMTGKIAASGSIMYLLDKDGSDNATMADHCFWHLFQNCTSLTTAPELPALTVSSSGYFGMFSGCTSLTTAPELPATTVRDYCYSNMFNGCTSLRQAPELPATQLGYASYFRMFQGCTSLRTAPSLSATSLVSQCYYGMFENCTSLTVPPSELPATLLANECYSSMFKGCTSLTKSPYIKFTTPGLYSCEYMFQDCSSLREIKIAYTDIFWAHDFYAWVDGVASSGTFYYNGAATIHSISAIPIGWTKTSFTP